MSNYKFYRETEVLLNPDDLLRQELAKCDKIYIKTFEGGRKLAQAINLTRAAQRSSSLNQFLKILQDSYEYDNLP